ncbi:hypothetical protein SDJN03_00004, partial [Cucurbita argyrosperma subsp. sororia]
MDSFIFSFPFTCPSSTGFPGRKLRPNHAAYYVASSIFHTRVHALSFGANPTLLLFHLILHQLFEPSTCPETMYGYTQNPPVHNNQMPDALKELTLGAQNRKSQKRGNIQGIEYWRYYIPEQVQVWIAEITNCREWVPGEPTKQNPNHQNPTWPSLQPPPSKACGDICWGGPRSGSRPPGTDRAQDKEAIVLVFVSFREKCGICRLAFPAELPAPLLPSIPLIHSLIFLSRSPSPYRTPGLLFGLLIVAFLACFGPLEIL